MKRFIWCVMIMLNWCVDAAAADDARHKIQKAVLHFMAMKKPRNVAQVHTHCLTPIARIVRANADAAKIIERDYTVSNSVVHELAGHAAATHNIVVFEPLLKCLVRRRVSLGVGVDFLESRATLLQIAAMVGFASGVELLLMRDARPNSVSDIKVTPLGLADIFIYRAKTTDPYLYQMRKNYEWLASLLYRCGAFSALEVKHRLERLSEPTRRKLQETVPSLELVRLFADYHAQHETDIYHFLSVDPHADRVVDDCIQEIQRPPMSWAGKVACAIL